jgi:hypothetical protein
VGSGADRLSCRRRRGRGSGRRGAGPRASILARSLGSIRCLCNVLFLSHLFSNSSEHFLLKNSQRNPTDLETWSRPREAPQAGRGGRVGREVGSLAQVSSAGATSPHPGGVVRGGRSLGAVSGRLCPAPPPAWLPRPGTTPACSARAAPAPTSLPRGSGPEARRGHRASGTAELTPAGFRGRLRGERRQRPAVEGEPRERQRPRATQVPDGAPLTAPHVSLSSRQVPSCLPIAAFPAESFRARLRLSPLPWGRGREGARRVAPRRLLAPVAGAVLSRSTAPSSMNGNRLCR